MISIRWRERGAMIRSWWPAVLLALAAATGAAATDRDDTGACPATIPSAPFTDTADLTAESVAAIDCVAHYGITSGVTPTTFVPDASVTRSQTARFLVRTAKALGVDIPAGDSSPFDDLDSLDEGGRRAISQLWALEITTGTGERTFDPAGPVLRRQIALFLARLLRAAGLESSGERRVPPYDDLDGLPAEVLDALAYLSNLGVGWGSGTAAFEPDRLVSREEMALLIAAGLEAGDALHVHLELDLSASRAPLTGAVVVTVTATTPAGKPYPGLLVDLFVTNGHGPDGTCRVDTDARLNAGDGATSADCRIDRADPRTDSRGQVSIGFTHGPAPETDRVYAWVGHSGQVYHEDLPVQVWAQVEWQEGPSRIDAGNAVTAKFGDVVRIEASLSGRNLGNRLLVMTVLQQGTVVLTRAATTSYYGKAGFFYVGPPDPSQNNDDPQVDVIRIFWDRNGNGVHDGPAEPLDETTVTWDD